MSELAFASKAMKERIAPAGCAPFVSTRIRKAADRLRWRYSRARDVWYGDPRVDLKPRELRRIEEVAGIRYGQQELNEVDALLARADALLMGGNPGFYGPLVTALRALVGAADRARTETDRPDDSGRGDG